MLDVPVFKLNLDLVSWIFILFNREVNETTISCIIGLDRPRIIGRIRVDHIIYDLIFVISPPLHFGGVVHALIGNQIQWLVDLISFLLVFQLDLVLVFTVDKLAWSLLDLNTAHGALWLLLQ